MQTLAQFVWLINREVNYCMVDTPERLIGFEPIQMHLVSHLPEAMRVTSWTIQRDLEKEKAIFEKVGHAQAYFLQVLEEFKHEHQLEVRA
jgi:hypothetical protein